MSILGCTFAITGSAIAFQTTGADFNIISNNVFTGDSSGVAIQPIGTANGMINSSMASTVTGNVFKGVRAVHPLIRDNSVDSWEGWTFSGNQFFASAVTISHANSINFINNQFVSAGFTINGAFNEIIEGNYFDTGTPGSTLLTVTNGNSNVDALQIEGNHFDAQGSADVTGILFVDGGTRNQTTNVTLKGNYYNGKSDAPMGGGYGVVFNDLTLRNLYLGGENFQLLTAALHFEKPIGKSTIDRFEARDVYYYAQNLAGAYHALKCGRPPNTHDCAPNDYYLRSDYLYRTFSIRLGGYLAGKVASNTVLATQSVIDPVFFTPPVISLSQTRDQHCSAGSSYSASDSYTGSFYINLIIGAASSPGFNYCDLTVTLDGTAYVSPR